jgi:RimJ/RimL family protein N-acetyltransferase
MGARWITDPEVRRGLAYRGIANEDAEVKWYEQMTEAGRAPRPAAVVFSVHDAADGELVGVCGIEGIDHISRAPSWGSSSGGAAGNVCRVIRGKRSPRA